MRGHGLKKYNYYWKGTHVPKHFHDGLVGRESFNPIEGFKKKNDNGWEWLYIRSTPHPVTVTTKIITYLVGNPYKPSFATVTGWGVDPSYTVIKLYTLHPKIRHPEKNDEKKPKVETRRKCTVKEP